MKKKFVPGSRYVKDSRVLHIKQTRANGVVTSRGFMTYDEINTWSKQDKPEKPISPVSAKLTKAEKEEMYRHFPTAAAAIRFAIETKSKPACGGNCGSNYCDEYGCIDRKKSAPALSASFDIGLSAKQKEASHE